MAPSATSIQAAHDSLVELASKPGLTAAAYTRFLKADTTLHALGAKCLKGRPRHLTPRPVWVPVATTTGPVMAARPARTVSPSPVASRTTMPVHLLALVYAPLVSNVVVTPTADGATVEWNVSPASYGRLEFGATVAYGNLTAPQVTPLGSHAQTITGMPAGSTVHFRIWTDAANAAPGDDRTFSTASATLYPATTTLIYRAENADAMPGYLSPITDSTFGTEIVRVTDIAGQRHRYSSIAAWNADESLLLLDYPPGGSGSQRAIRDGTTYAVLSASNDTMGNFTWCNTLANKNVAWAYSGLTIRKLAVTGAGISVTSSTSLAGYGYAAINLGGGQGSISADDRYLAFMWKKANNDHGIGVFDTSTLTVISSRLVGNATNVLGDYVNNVGMSQSGLYVVGGMDDGDATGPQFGTHIYPRDLSSDRQVTTGQAHWDAGLLADGTTDVLIIASQSATGGGTGSRLGMYRMSDGAFTALLANWPNGHISCRNTGRPGWAYVSSFSYSGETFAGYHNVFAVRLDAPADVQMFASVHGPTASGYETEPQFCASPTGTRGVFASKWGGSSVYPFVCGVNV